MEFSEACLKSKQNSTNYEPLELTYGLEYPVRKIGR